MRVREDHSGRNPLVVSHRGAHSVHEHSHLTAVVERRQAMATIESRPSGHADSSTPCPSCNAAVPDDVSVCPSCGAQDRGKTIDGTRVFESPADKSRRHVTNIVVTLVTIVVAIAVFILLANFVGTS